MPLVGYEATIQAFEREKTFHALDRAATVLSYFALCQTGRLRLN
jgi:hypothetical protein